MNIDLFMTTAGEAGLLCDAPFQRTPVGALYDAETREVTIEFDGHGTNHLNIPVEEKSGEKILFARRLRVGVLTSGMLSDALDLPLYYLNDPFGGAFCGDEGLPPPKRSVLGFQTFLARCSFAQALNRDDLGDERTARSVLAGANLRALTIAPSLLRQAQMEALVAREHAPVSAPAVGLGGTASRAVSLKTRREDDTDRRGT